ncbi:MAG: sugar transferase [Candidatus Aminicenantes bacterium]|nr:sugar transferase [Candidatus Aminicenantes bacterium]
MNRSIRREYFFSAQREQTRRARLHRAVTKKAMDIVLCLVLVAPFSFLILFFSILIILEDFHLPFYVDHRMGQRGKKIKILKLRTMSCDADAIFNKFLRENPDKKREWEQFRKIKGKDPRLTRIGEFLRKYSLDELPQIFNVIAGKISFIGPRPYQPEEKAAMGSSCNLILSFQPGLTGFWQTAGRNDLTFSQRLEMDLEYIHQWSLRVDLKILLKTIKVVLQGKGAY